MLQIIIDITSGLEVLHQVNLIHGNLKLENVLIDTKGNAKISEYGISKVLRYSTKYKNLRYESLEVLKGGAMDSSNDIWGLGCIAYELCCYEVSLDCYIVAV